MWFHTTWEMLASNNKIFLTDPDSLQSAVSRIHVVNKSELLNWDRSTHNLRSYFKSNFISEIVNRSISIQQSWSDDCMSVNVGNPFPFLTLCDWVQLMCIQPFWKWVPTNKTWEWHDLVLESVHGPARHICKPKANFKMRPF